jgi:Xaa-Pro aminopeptidase
MRHAEVGNKALQRPSPEVFRRRRAALAEVLARRKLDAYFFSGMSDLYYLTGFMSEGYYGLFSAAGESWIFSSALLAGQIRENTSGLRLLVGKRLTVALRELRARRRLKRVGFDAEQLVYRLGALLAKEGLAAAENPLAELRIVKDREELACLRRACETTARSIGFIRTKLKVGVTEKALAAELEAYFYRQGAEKVAFDLIVAMGPHTALPHHVPGATRLTPHQPVIFDIGCTVGGYRSDLTRTLFFGRIVPLFQRVYRVVESAQKAGMARVRPGSTGGDVDAAARRVIAQAGYARHFIHSTGHGVGVDIHEPPWIRPKSPDVLKPGMVLTVEPGIYLPGKFGVRIEDTVVVTASGYDVLTQAN